MTNVQIHRTQDANRKLGIMKFETVWAVTIDGVLDSIHKTNRAAVARKAEIEHNQ